MKNKLIHFIRYSINVFAALLIVVLLLRLFEFTYIIFFAPTIGYIEFELRGFVTDLSVVCFYQLCFSIISSVFIWNKKIYRFLLHFFALLLIAFTLSLLVFFITAKVPLDHSIYSYSFAEITTTIKSSQIGLKAYFLIIAPFLLYFFIFKLFKPSEKRFLKITLIAFYLLSPLFYFILKVNLEKDGNIMQKNLAKNKTDFFIKKSVFYFSNNKTNLTFNNKSIVEFLNYRTIDNFYAKADLLNKETSTNTITTYYPLLHYNNFDPLDEYFKLFKSKPNIVIIVFESLGEIFFNKDYYSLSFLPFLDSLKNKSLYWSNCFSTSERTFEVTPSLLGSLPYGRTGFCDIDNYPNHITLISLLRDNGYFSAFFYGGWTGFHNMSRFHDYQRIDYMSEYFPKSKYNNPNNKDFSWGHSDGDMMKRSIDVIDSVNKKPMINFYLTLSSHSPFAIPNVETMKNNCYNIINKQKYIDKNNLYKNIEPYAAFNYTDNCIKELINDYKKKGLYDSTIFIITGDHYSHEIGCNNKLEVYNVPLIIHSPLLIKNAHFEAITSHLDVAPSIINLLKNRHLINAPSQFHWLGYGLETNNNPNMKFIPFIKNNKDIEECIWQNYFYSYGKLYTFKNKVNIKNIENEAIKVEIVKRLENFNIINNYTCDEQMIYPLINYNIKSKFDTIFIYQNKNINSTNFTINNANITPLAKFALQNNYIDVIFEFSFNMMYSNSMVNPNIVAKIYNKNKEIDYFYFTNNKYKSNNNVINVATPFYIVRKIKNTNGIFNKNNFIELLIDKSEKNIEVSNLSIRVYGILN